MKKKIIAVVAIIAIAAFAFYKIDFSAPGTSKDVVIGEKGDAKEAIKVTLTVDDSVLVDDKNKSKLKEEIQKQVSKDGKILDEQVIEIYGEKNVIDVLKAVDQANDKISFSFKSAGGMEYLAGVNGIDAGIIGANSGWMYRMNGKLASVGMKDTILKNGDKINIKYSLDGMAEFEAESKK
ncbi:MAG: DUF4430 domain-containing protein [Erysipelotrichales bacterium]